MFNIPVHSQHVMLAIVAVLVVGTVCYLWLSRRHTDRDYLELKLRIRSWWWMVAIAFVGHYHSTTHCFSWAFSAF